MTKIPQPGFDICSAAVVWGAVSAATASVQNYEELLAVHVFLYVTEAVFFAGVIYFLSAWYTRNELGKRLAALFMFQMLGSAFGGVIAAACLTLDGRYGIAGWRWLFIVEGVVTVGCGLIFALIMPEYPHNARLPQPIERDFGVWRLESEAGAGEAHEDTTTSKGFKLALLDPKIWTLVWCMSMAQAMGTIINFCMQLQGLNPAGSDQKIIQFFNQVCIYTALSLWTHIPVVETGNMEALKLLVEAGADLEEVEVWWYHATSVDDD